MHSGLVDAPWAVGSAVALVIVAWMLTLLAGAVVAQLTATAWDPVAKTWVAAGVLLAMYASLIGMVWGRASSRGVSLADSVGLDRAAGPSWYATGLGAALLGWGFSAAFTTALGALGVELPREDLAVFKLLPGGPLGVALTIVMLVVVAPFVEEIVYRGVLLSSLDTRWGAGVALAASSVVFSAAHVSLVGFVPLVVAGALFGWLFMRSGSLRVAIVAHAAYNALGVVALFATKSLRML
jgi:membrane protease YdiL (CAAX protease family)